MSLFSFVKNIIPSGTVFGDMLGSERKKGSGFMGIHIGKAEYQQPDATLAGGLDGDKADNTRNIFLWIFGIIVAGYLLVTYTK